MKAVFGYFDGKSCVPTDSSGLRPNQRVIITVLDEFVEQKNKKLEKPASELLDEITGILGSSKERTVKEIKEERLESV